MKLTIYRGTNEIGGALIEIKTTNERLLLDAGYPLFLNGKPIEEHIKKLSYSDLLNLDILPNIKGLYRWDTPNFDGVLISHAH